MSIDLILGTAGHIDHGKTSLIRALTGEETDRLPEEKKRGITIELGYAHLDLPPFRLGIVDVPGHEKFVRQMLAGATGMDLAMLVVAADDSVKQQTREHLDILRLLDLPAGVIALTKCDLVEEEWLDLVQEEIRELVQPSFLADAPIVRTSSHTGAGIEELKKALQSAAEQAAASDRQNRLQAPFRMPIDRCFAIEGHGTVVTGSVASGTARTGDQLLLQPGNVEVRIRGLQNHESATAEVHCGQRAAVNLAGVHHEQVHRGQELCAPGHLVPSRLVTVELHLLKSEKRPLRDRTRVRFHVGTAELFGNVRLLEGDEIAPGESGLAQIFLNEPAVTTWNQPFVIRRQSPMVTIGGGRILHPNAHRIRRPGDLALERLRQLTSPEAVTRANASLFFSDDPELSPASLARTAGIADPNPIWKQLIEDGKLVGIKVSATRTLHVQIDRFREISDRVEKSLGRLHDRNPLRFSHPLQALDVEFAYLDQPELLKAVIGEMQRANRVTVRNGSIGLVGRGPKLSKGERQVMDWLVDVLKTQGTRPDSPKELQSAAPKNRDSVPQLLELAAENGDLVRISDDIFLNSRVFDELKEQIAAAIREHDGLPMSELRKVIDTSRKYAVPIFEYLDETGFTCRQGDLRLLGETPPS